MRRQLIASGLCFSLLAGCASVSESRFNPLNWFGRSEAVPQQVSATGERVIVLPTLAPRKGYPEFVDTRPLAPALADVRVEKSASGAIVTAIAVLPSLGFFDAQLVPVEDGDPATLTFDYRLRAPTKSAPAGTDAQRRLPAAYSISFEKLAGVRTIIVRAANGARQVRR